MKFEILEAQDSYGNHRYSNNAILAELDSNLAGSSDELLFVWWVEKMFLDPRFKETVERLKNTHWFGVMHIPLLTPTWAMNNQNNIGHLYFMESWRQAQENCRGIICFSTHMKEQLELVYPNLNSFYLMHPLPAEKKLFDYAKFCENPRIVLIGTWLRNFDAFVGLKAPWERRLLVNLYTDRYLEQEYSRYSPRIADRLQAIECSSFLDDDAYDELLCSSVVFMGCHETSANNALCECISYSVPFVSLRHPAIEEYCGKEYPLFLDDYACAKSLTKERVLEAHLYLKENEALRTRLSMDKFLVGMKDIYQAIGPN